MARLALCLAVLFALLLATVPVHAAATASVLSLVSPPDLVPRTNDAPLVAVNAARQVTIVYKAKRGQEKFLPISATGSANSWTHHPVPLPPQVTQYQESLTLRHLLAGSPAQGLDLLASHYGKLFLWHSSGGN